MSSGKLIAKYAIHPAHFERCGVVPIPHTEDKLRLRLGLADDPLDFVFLRANPMRSLSLRFTPLVATTSIGISYALHLNGRTRINLSGSFYRFCLCWLVTADPVSVRSPDRIIALWTLFNKQFAAHKLLLRIN